MCRPRGCGFDLKTGIDFARICLESVIEDGFQWNHGSVWTNLSFQFQMSKNERITREFEMNFTKEILLLAF